MGESNSIQERSSLWIHMQTFPLSRLCAIFASLYRTDILRSYCCHSYGIQGPSDDNWWLPRWPLSFLEVLKIFLLSKLVNLYGTRTGSTVFRLFRRRLQLFSSISRFSCCEVFAGLCLPLGLIMQWIKIARPYFLDCRHSWLSSTPCACLSVRISCTNRRIPPRLYRASNLGPPLLQLRWGPRVYVILN